MRAITIVVPAYGHVPSFTECIQSVLEHGELSINNLLIVNDDGPEADQIEQTALKLTKGLPNTRYVRNNSNLGFVKTCNRAALELDTTGNDVLLLNSDAKLTPGALQELSKVLYSSEKHGVACPRSSSAGLSTLPYYPHGKRTNEDEYSFELHSKIKNSLPEFTVVPVSVGFCILIKRFLIDNFGLFDTIFSPGYDEENDFCMRINEVGYSSVMANRAFVYHLGSKSFEDKKRNRLQKAHHKILTSRYPHYERTVRNYLDFRMDPADQFSDFIFPSSSERPKILLDVSSLGPVHNGSSRVAIAVLEEFARLAQSDHQIAEFTIRAPEKSISFFKLDKYGFKTIAKEDSDEYLFDLGVAVTPIWHVDQLHYFNFACSRWVLTHFDVIALRTHSLLDSEHIRRLVVLDSVRFADKVVSISSYATDDLIEFFSEDSQQLKNLATETKTLGALKEESILPQLQNIHDQEDGSILVIGNHFKHKQVSNTVKALSDLDCRIIVLGGNESHKISSNIEIVKTGNLSNQAISNLYLRAKCVVFPSHYEGYGLPIAEAQLHHTPIVLFDSAVSREVVHDLGFEDGAYFYKDFHEIPKLIDLASHSLPIQEQAKRTLDDYSQDLVRIVLAQTKTVKDVDQLRDRVEYFRSVLAYEEEALNLMNNRLNRRAYKTADVFLNFVATPAKSIARLIKNRQQVASIRRLNSRVFE